MLVIVRKSQLQYRCGHHVNLLLRRVKSWSAPVDRSTFWVRSTT